MQSTDSGHALFAHTFAEVPMLASSRVCAASGKAGQGVPGSFDLAVDVCNLGSMASVRLRNSSEVRVLPSVVRGAC